MELAEELPPLPERLAAHRDRMEQVHECMTTVFVSAEKDADGRLTMADLKVFVDVRGLNAGRLDHVPADLVQQVAPLLNAHQQRVAQTPAIARYYTQVGA